MKKRSTKKKTQRTSDLLGADKVMKYDKSYSLVLKNLPGVFLLAALLGSLYMLYGVIAPFLTVIFVAGVLAITFYPIYRRILKFFRGAEIFSALTACLLVVLVIVAPITFFVLILGVEAVETYDVIQAKINTGVFDQYFQWEPGGYFYDMKQYITQRILPVVDLDAVDLKTRILGWGASFSDYLFTQVGAFVSKFANFVFEFMLMLFTMFYFFKDGERLVAKLGLLLPIPISYENELFA